MFFFSLTACKQQRIYKKIYKNLQSKHCHFQTFSKLNSTFTVTENLSYEGQNVDKQINIRFLYNGFTKKCIKKNKVTLLQSNFYIFFVDSRYARYAYNCNAYKKTCICFILKRHRTDGGLNSPLHFLATKSCTHIAKGLIMLLHSF